MRKGHSVVLLGGAVLLATISSLAWACSPRAAEIQLVPTAIPVGSSEPVKVTSTDFIPGQLVEIRWNSYTGPVVGGLVGPDHSLSIRPPAGTTPGVYYIVAKGGWASEVLQVTGQGISADSGRYSAGDLWTGFSKASSGAEPFSGGNQISSSHRSFALGAIMMAVASLTILFALCVAVVRRPTKARG